jgi:hypothetical protein
MDRSEICRALEEEFAMTVVKELIPGILHNFANPLNGIMGRSKLVRRRIEENIKKIKETYPEAAAGMLEELQRVRAEILDISKEAELFFNIFSDVANKSYALASKGESRINLSHLLTAEMRFFNFYLDFKHKIKKDIRLNNDIPDLKANKADLSMAFWRLIHFTMSRSLASNLKEFYITTEYDNKYVSVFIKYSGEAFPDADIEALMKNVNSGSLEMSNAVIDRGVLLSFLILNKYQVRINILSEKNFSTISIGFPYLVRKN